MAFTFLFPAEILAEEPAQDKTTFATTVGSLLTGNSSGAVNFVAGLLEELGPTSIAGDRLITNCTILSQSAKQKCIGEEGQGWVLNFAPDVNVQIGSENTFQSIVMKSTGNFIFFDRIKIPGVPNTTIDTANAFTVIPISAGFETTKNLDTTNAIVEIGYVPFGSKTGKFLGMRLGTQIKFGVFLQGGYKIKIDNAPPARTGGETDESEEAADSGLGRVKMDFGFDYNLINSLPITGDLKIGVNLIPKATGWYDFVNNEFYHTASAIIRFSLDEGRSFDLAYQNGSGAPNFNEGNQFSANLTLQF